MNVYVLFFCGLLYCLLVAIGSWDNSLCGALLEENVWHNPFFVVSFKVYEGVVSVLKSFHQRASVLQIQLMCLSAYSFFNLKPCSCTMEFRHNNVNS